MVAALLAPAGSPAPALAAESPRIGVELNRLEPRGDGCRMLLVIDNPAARGLASFDLDLVIFDREGIIASRLVVEAGPLRGRKLSVREFDVPGLACPAIGRVLVNDIPGCRTDGGDAIDCLERVDLSSRAGVDLVR